MRAEGEEVTGDGWLCGGGWFEILDVVAEVAVSEEYEGDDEEEEFLLEEEIFDSQTRRWDISNMSMAFEI